MSSSDSNKAQRLELSMRVLTYETPTQSRAALISASTSTFFTPSETATRRTPCGTLPPRSADATAMAVMSAARRCMVFCTRVAAVLAARARRTSTQLQREGPEPNSTYTKRFMRFFEAESK